MNSYKPLGYLLGRSLRIFKNLMAIEFKNQGIELTFEQFVILNMLNSNENVIQQDLANYLQKDKSIIVRQVNELLEKQFIHRLTVKDDKRKKNLTLTPQGIEILYQLKEISTSVSEKLLSGINDSDLDIFRNVLERIELNAGIELDSINFCSKP